MDFEEDKGLKDNPLKDLVDKADSPDDSDVVPTDDASTDIVDAQDADPVDDDDTAGPDGPASVDDIVDDGDDQPVDQPADDLPSDDSPDDQPTDFDESSFLKENFSDFGEFETLDDFKSHIESLKKDTEPQDEFLQRFTEAYKQDPGFAQEYLNIQSTNWEALGTEELIRQHMLEDEENRMIFEKDPGLFNREFKRQVLDQLNMTEEQIREIEEEDPSRADEIRIQQRKLESLANKYQQEKIKAQKEWKIPEKQQDQFDPDDYREKISKSPTVKGFLENKSLVFDSKGDTPFTLKVEDPAAITEMAVDVGNKFFSKLIDENNAPNELFLKVAQYVNDPETFEKELIQHGKNLGKDDKDDLNENSSIRRNQKRRKSPEVDSKLTDRQGAMKKIWQSMM